MKNLIHQLDIVKSIARSLYTPNSISLNKEELNQYTGFGGFEDFTIPMDKIESLVSKPVST